MNLTLRQWVTVAALAAFLWLLLVAVYVGLVVVAAAMIGPA